VPDPPRNIHRARVGSATTSTHPNILLIYWDDLGYGDIITTNLDSKFPIPHSGRLARGGLSFNAAHATAAVCGLDSGTSDRLQEYGHAGMGIRRRIKTEVSEGGHRTPMIVRWPGAVTPQRQSSALVSFTHWFATLAQLTGQPVPPRSGEDSLSFLRLLQDDFAPPHRQSMVHHSTHGVLAIRQSDWIYLDGDAFPADEPEWYREMPGVSLSDEPGQLYQLTQDPSQSRNLAADYPAKVDAMRTLLAQIMATPQ
jgi:arylsulfatase A